MIEINGALANQGENSNIAVVRLHSRKNGGETSEYVTMVAFISREQSESFRPDRRAAMPQRIKGKIRPRGGLVVVRKHEIKDNVTKGGVLIPGAVANNNVVFATVMEVGPGQVIDSGARVKMDLKPGDTVLMQVTRDTMPLSVEDRDIFLVSERNIVANIEQENENEQTADESDSESEA